MAKRKSANKTPVVMNKQKLLLPKMEFAVLDEATGEGFYVRELGGKSLLEYKEKILQAEKDAGEGVEITELQSVDLMIELVFRTACNANGTPYFSSRQEAELFAEASLVKLQIVADKAMDVSCINTEAKNNIKNEENSSSTDS